ncbi:MAG: hypothetical protein M3440_04665 [Chloroflexota bacterium]|nr:hypothetical protein [Chloroflexota bacterium]
MFAIVKRIRNTPRDGILVDVEWYTEDPSDDRDMRPMLIDQLIVPVESATGLSEAALDAALNRRMLEVTPAAAPAGEATAAVKAMMGHARTVTGNGPSVRPKRVTR